MYGGKFAFQNRLGLHIVGRKLTVFALLYFVFEGNFPSTSPPGACTWKIAHKYKVKKNLLPTIRLAQSISKRKFPSVDDPLRI